MNLTILMAIITIVATISGIILGWAGRARSAKKDIQSDATDMATIKGDISHIREGIEDIKKDMRGSEDLFRQHCLTEGCKIDALSDRVAKVEEVAKSAHKRIDELKGA